MRYLNGRIQEPQPNDPAYDKWEAENSTVMSWLLYSMQPKISQGYLFLHTAKEVWDVAAQTYSKVGNATLKYDLKRRIHGLTQGDSLVAPYFHKLRSLWQELDHYQNLQPMCAVDATQIKKIIEEECIYEFLGRLNSEYDPMRVQIFGKESLPSLQEVFSYIQNEESHRSTMLHSSSQSQSALVGTTQRTPTNSSRFRDKDRIADEASDDKDKLFCDHCNRSRHTRETCWKLQGRPTQGRGGHTGGGFRPWAHHTSTIETTTPTLDTSSSTRDIGGLSKDEVEALHRLMSRLDTPTTAASSSVLIDNLATALNASATPPNDPWVIDSGASDHMTGISPLFSSYNPCSGKDKVRIADGSLLLVLGKWSVSIIPSMTLAFVFHVPNLAANLLSIARITIELNCCVIFYSYYCFFQDLAMGKMIGSGSLNDGLYYLDSRPDTHGRLIQAYHTVRADDSAARIWLWHQRLGHPSFLILQRMFPTLFLHNNVSKFQYETCELSKHYLVSFSPSINKSDAPFVLVHTDVWGPLRVVSLSGCVFYWCFFPDHMGLLVKGQKWCVFCVSDVL
jgi:hypothetical protein